MLSAGSLLGQNMLDALAKRRHKVQIIGLDANAFSARIYRCDKVYLSPLTASPFFESFLLQIINAEKPHLVLPGGDQDVVFLSRFKEKYPELSNLLPVGSSNAAAIINDKALSYSIAVKHKLPFASTLVLESTSLKAALKWATDISYPLIAKPRNGYASLGVKFIVDESQVEELFNHHQYQYILQEILDYNQETEDYIRSFQKQIKSGIPLFTYLPDHHEYTAQTCILPDGNIDKIFTSITSMIIGRCEKSVQIDNIELTSVSLAYARAMASEGWRGMLNLQLKLTNKGFIAYEMNGRMSGSTSARELVGYDEIGLVAKHFAGFDISSYASASNSDGFVYRSLTDYYVSNSAPEELAKNKVWQRSKTG